MCEIDNVHLSLFWPSSLCFVAWSFNIFFDGIFENINKYFIMVMILKVFPVCPLIIDQMECIIIILNKSKYRELIEWLRVSTG